MGLRSLFSRSAVIAEQPASEPITYQYVSPELKESAEAEYLKHIENEHLRLGLHRPVLVDRQARETDAAKKQALQGLIEQLDKRVAELEADHAAFRAAFPDGA